MSTDKETQIFELISEVIGISRNSLSIDSEIGNPPEWDSFAQISIMLELEKKLNMRFTPEQISELNSVRIIVEFVESTK